LVAPLVQVIKRNADYYSRAAWINLLSLGDQEINRFSNRDVAKFYVWNPY